MGRLTDIANRHTTDKGTEHYEKHGYTEVYDQYIPEKGMFTLLEIGIWHGDSLRMWKEYNPELNVHGVDIDKNVLNYISTGNGITVHIDDATKREFIDKFTDKSFDFIIDDGSHRYSDIITSFNFLFPYLKSGGYYFIEDLHAPFAHLNTLKFELDRMGIAMSLWNDKLLIIKK